MSVERASKALIREKNSGNSDRPDRMALEILKQYQQEYYHVRGHDQGISQDPHALYNDAVDESIFEHKEALLEAVASRKHRILPSALKIFKKL